jgi:sec-independent protein translocase protein TatA
LPTLGLTELIIILILILILFGVGRLPEVGRSLGEGMRELRESAKLMKENERELTELVEEEVKELEGEDPGEG